MTLVPCNPNDGDGANLSQNDFWVLRDNICAFFNNHGIQNFGLAFFYTLQNTSVSGGECTRRKVIEGIIVKPDCAAITIHSHLSGFRFLD